MMKTYLFILRKPAHSGAYVQEILDIILTTAAFDQKVSLLLLDDGVFHLKNNQQPESLGMKDTASIFKVLTLYDVNDIYIEEESVHERGLLVSDLVLSVNAIRRKQYSGLLKRFDVVLFA